MARRISKKEEQHRLASPALHEVEEWTPPRFRRRKPPEQLPGQLDLAAALPPPEDGDAP
jgi:hypothetical protein